MTEACGAGNYTQQLIDFSARLDVADFFSGLSGMNADSLADMMGGMNVPIAVLEEWEQSSHLSEVQKFAAGIAADRLRTQNNRT